MRFSNDFRLKVIHFFRKYKKIIFIALTVWGIIILINYMLKNRVIEPKPTTTYEPHTSIINQSSSTPLILQEPIEDLIEEYISCCNEQEYEKAYFMLSDECRKYGFNNSQTRFLQHVLTKIPNPRKYSIQNYSNVDIDGKKMYIYEIKYTEDVLATGLTNSEYVYTSEKMAFYKDEEGNIEMSVGSYIYQNPIQSISENEYLKIDVLNKIVEYDEETYEIKFTNRCEHTIVISDGYGTAESELQLGNETRKRIETSKIILEPGESLTKAISFQKFVDDGDNSLAVIFGSIRVMEIYSGTEDVEEEIILSEIDNALAKFSMSISVK